MEIDSENLKFLSSSTFYEENNGAISVEKSPRVTPTSKHIYVNYNWFGKHVGKLSVIHKIEYENKKVDILGKGLQGEIFLRIRKFLRGW